MKKIGMLLVLIVLFFPARAFSQGVKLDLVRFSTGSGKWETMLTAGGAMSTESRESVVLQVAGSLLLVADAFQTLNASSRAADGEKFENNPILGNHPSDSEICSYMGGALLIYNLGAWFLEEPLRTAWLKGWVTVQVGTVASNYKKGIGF